MVRAPSKSASPAPLGTLDDRPSIAQTLANLRVLIHHTLQLGQRRLPSERDLVSRLGVGRLAIREALEVLEREGDVVRHVGRGTFITSKAGLPPPQLQALAHAGALAVNTQVGLSSRELIEVRYALEPTIAELAAHSARPADLDRLLKCMQEREDAARLDDYEHWDYELHMAIAKATHNSMLVEMLDLVNRMRRTAIWRQFRAPSMDEAKRKTSNQQHREIVLSICQAEPERAFNAMRAHLSHVRTSAAGGVFEQGEALSRK